MRIQFQAMIALALVGAAAMSIPALSRPNPNGLEQDLRAQSAREQRVSPARNIGNKAARKTAKHGGKHKKKRVVYRPGVVQQASLVPVDDRYGNSDPIVSEARRYVGTNPTEMSRRWCARFMNMVLNKLGYSGTGSDAARSFASYGRRISGPRVGAIAVLTRGKNKAFGHVGVISGLDARGNPIIVSGNHGRRVAESVYPRSRVIAYVVPTEKGRTMLAGSDLDLPDLGKIFAKVGDAIVTPAQAETRRDADVKPVSRVRVAQAAPKPRAVQQIGSSNWQVERGPAQRTAQLRVQPQRPEPVTHVRGEKKPEFALAVEATMARMLSGR